MGSFVYKEEGLTMSDESVLEEQEEELTISEMYGMRAAEITQLVMDTYRASFPKPLVMEILYMALAANKKEIVADLMEIAHVLVVRLEAAGTKTILISAFRAAAISRIVPLYPGAGERDWFLDRWRALAAPIPFDPDALIKKLGKGAPHA